jgi:hypothetical protein
MRGGAAAPTAAETQHNIKLVRYEAATQRGVADGHRLGVVKHPCQIDNRTSKAGHPEGIDLADLQLRYGSNMQVYVGPDLAATRPCPGQMDPGRQWQPNRQPVKHRGGMVTDDRLGCGLTQGCEEESPMLEMRIGLVTVRVRAAPNPGELAGAR